ncbi:hypothetical protein [Capnocytophaga canimorsus]|nr:hypothetical protein [Capnocytophaga canimorsus]
MIRKISLLFVMLAVLFTQYQARILRNRGIQERTDGMLEGGLTP